MITVRPGKPRFSQRALCSELRRRLPTNVQAAFLFGSYASKSAHDLSDIDVVVVYETRRAWPERFVDFPKVLALGNVDLLAYTPEEYAQLQRFPSAFWREIRKTAILLL